MAKRDNKLAARVLAEAHFNSDEKVAQKYGITRRTVVSYRAALQEDQQLSQLFLEALHEAIKRPWADELSETLTTALRKIGARLEAVEAGSLDEITQLVGLTRELMELEMSRMYAESETRGNDSADDLGARQALGATRQTEASRLLS